MSINEMLVSLAKSQMDLQSIQERISGLHDTFLHIRHKTSAVFPGPKRFIRGSVLYPPLNCTGDLDEFIKYSRLAELPAVTELPAQRNSYPLVEEGRIACCSLHSSIQ